jgi:flagellar FliJ protein
MTRHFRLQRVLDLRERAEQETARRLASRQHDAEKARDAHASLEALRTTSRDQVEQVHQDGTAVGHLQHMSYLLGQLDRRIAGASDEVIDAEQAVTRVRGELDSAVRDRRILERLRERHDDDIRQVDQAADRVLMDDIALARYARQRADADPTVASSQAARDPDGELPA